MRTNIFSNRKLQLVLAVSLLIIISLTACQPDQSSGTPEPTTEAPTAVPLTATPEPTAVVMDATCDDLLIDDLLNFNYEETGRLSRYIVVRVTASYLITEPLRQMVNHHHVEVIDTWQAELGFSDMLGTLVKTDINARFAQAKLCSNASATAVAFADWTSETALQEYAEAGYFVTTHGEGLMYSWRNSIRPEDSGQPSTCWMFDDWYCQHGVMTSLDASSATRYLTFEDVESLEGFQFLPDMWYVFVTTLYGDNLESDDMQFVDVGTEMDPYKPLYANSLKDNDIETDILIFSNEAAAVRYLEEHPEFHR